MKAACAIANFGGGFIVVGIEEDGNNRAKAIKHVPNGQSTADSVRQSLRDGISPRPVFEVSVLSVDALDVIVVRISPRNSPHMVSKDKRTDFYGRYDATSERMRYEEIEERFRDKHRVSETLDYQTPSVILESTIGRTSVSQGTEGFLRDTTAKIVGSGGPALAIVAASEGMVGSVTSKTATEVFREPLYSRHDGWLVAHPQAEVVSRLAGWEQPYPGNVTRITSSGDVVFIASVDGPLCRDPDQLYPYAVAEYCVSFSYLLADLVASSRPVKLLITPILAAQTRRLRLPLGEPGSIWFDAQKSSANSITGNSVGVPIVEQVPNGRPLLSRRLAFQIAKQIYEFFSYSPEKVAFAYNDEVTVEPDAITATLISVRAYLRDSLLTHIEPPHEDKLRRTFSMGFELNGARHILWVSDMFLRTHHWDEKRLFQHLDSIKLMDKVRASGKDDKLLLGTDGVVPFPD